MKCKFCGEEINKDDIRCASCGGELERITGETLVELCL